MADIINFFQLNFFVSVSSFSQIGFNNANSSTAAGLAKAGRASSNIPSGGKNQNINAGNSGPVLSDNLNISDSARALGFLRDSLVKSGFTPAAADNYSRRYAEDPVLDQKLNELFTLLEPLFDDKSKFRENVEKFMANFAKLTNHASNSHISDSLSDLASKIENIKNKRSTAAAEVAAVEVSIEISIVDGKVQFSEPKQTDPLVLDMDGNGFKLTSAADGAKFDIDADGVMDKMAVAKGNDAMLTVDKNNNGVIDDGKELFGDQNGAADGFSELAKYDDNKDEKIDNKDNIFESLKLLRYVKNSKGEYDQKISSLKSSGISAIDLSKVYKANEEINGNSIVKKSFAYINNNENNYISVADAMLENYRL